MLAGHFTPTNNIPVKLQKRFRRSLQGRNADRWLTVIPTRQSATASARSMTILASSVMQAIRKVGMTSSSCSQVIFLQTIKSLQYFICGYSFMVTHFNLCKALSFFSEMDCLHLAVGVSQRNQEEYLPGNGEFSFTLPFLSSRPG